MLILKRNKNEKIIIGDNISITVLGIEGSCVHIGVLAPKEISVHRDEVYFQIRKKLLFEKRKFRSSANDQMLQQIVK